MGSLSSDLACQVDCCADGRLDTFLNRSAAVADGIARIIAAEQLLPGQVVRSVSAGVIDCHRTNHYTQLRRQDTVLARISTVFFFLWSELKRLAVIAVCQLSSCL
jgi:hypothetical protein